MKTVRDYACILLESVLYALGTVLFIFPQRLLQILRKNGCGLVLSSDSHRADTLSFGFDEARLCLKDQGFTHLYVLYNGEFVKDEL